MKESTCNWCPQGMQVKQCGMWAAPMHESEILRESPIDEIMLQVMHKIPDKRAFLQCWYYRCPEGQLSALHVYRKHTKKGQQGVYPFGTSHKSQILEEGFGITGRYVVVGNDPGDESVIDGDIVIQNQVGAYIYLTNINIKPPRT